MKEKGAAVTTRRKVPAIIYGGDSAPVSLCRSARTPENTSKRRFTQRLSKLLTMVKKKSDLEGASASAKDFPTHADFFRVEENKAIKVSVPLHFVNEETCVGVAGGGHPAHSQRSEVRTLPNF